MPDVTACAYRVDPDLLERLERALGSPEQTFFRGWQVWVNDRGPGGERLEWRLHPPPGFRLPRGLRADDLFDAVLAAIAEDPDGPLPLGPETRPLPEVWEVLEVWAFDGEPLAPAALAGAVAQTLGGRAPDAEGTVDHDALNAAWERSRGELSLGTALLTALGPGNNGALPLLERTLGDDW